MFQNLPMLFGLLAVMIPVIIHLLNRRRARVVDWGAMQFLLASLASRNRRILIEEIVLMSLRCLLLAMLAVAMARPFLPTRAGLSWAIVLPAVLVAAVLIAIAASAWTFRRARWMLLAGAAALLLIAAGAVATEHWRQDKQWAGPGGAAQDIAVILDGSMSMGLESEGKSNFERALEEVRAVVGAIRPADAVSVILGGPVPRYVVPTPISDREELNRRLESLRPVHGSMRALDALNAAAATLAEGHNPGKRIVLITDGQSVGWELDRSGRWTFLSANLKELPTTPKLICRTLPPPREFENLCVAAVTFSRNFVGTDREVEIDVKLTNTGSKPTEGGHVALLIDGEEIARQTVTKITPNASETVTFSHRFETYGPKVVTAKAACEDDLEADNTVDRVLHVVRQLPVLMVEGAPSKESLGGATAFLKIALSPPRDGAPAKRKPKPGPDPKADKGKDKSQDKKPPSRSLIEPRVVRLTDLPKIEDLSKYRAIILANVAALPKEFANRLPGFVRKGGGVLMVLGNRSERRFYNTWIDKTGKRICPAELKQRISAAETPVKLDLKSFRHPALAEKIADPAQSDAERATVNAYWVLSTDEEDTAVRVGGRLNNGHPFLVERKLGKGFVLMTATALHEQETNLTALKCFVPLVHELVHFLAEPLALAGNVKPGTEVVLPLSSLAKAPEGLSAGDEVDVTTPDGERKPGGIFTRDGKLHARFTGAEEPGLYRFHLDKNAPGAPTSASASRSAELPFAVVGDPRESRLDKLGGRDLERIESHVEMLHAKTTSELTAHITGGVPGESLWKYLVLLAAIAVVGEIALTRWIAIRRKAHAIRTVHFGASAIDTENFRAKAQGLVSVPPVEETVEAAGRR